MLEEMAHKNRVYKILNTLEFQVLAVEQNFQAAYFGFQYLSTKCELRSNLYIRINPIDFVPLIIR